MCFSFSFFFKFLLFLIVALTKAWQCILCRLIQSRKLEVVATKQKQKQNNNNNYSVILSSSLSNCEDLLWVQATSADIQGPDSEEALLSRLMSRACCLQIPIEFTFDLGFVNEVPWDSGPRA